MAAREGFTIRVGPTRHPVQVSVEKDGAFWVLTAVGARNREQVRDRDFATAAARIRTRVEERAAEHRTRVEQAAREARGARGGSGGFR